MDPNDLLGHIANLCVISGLILIARHKISGWGLRLIGDGLWIWIGLQIGMGSIWIWGFVFMATNLYGLISWLRDENKVE